MCKKSLVFNGIDADTGDYLLPPLTPEEFSAIIQQESPNEALRKRLRWWHQKASEECLGPKAGVDPKNLAETGWGVIFARGTNSAIKKALSPLLEHRRQQATKIHEGYYRELIGDDTYRPDESAMMFLNRHGASSDPVDPAKLPYYLLIVGDPRSIPYSFQYELDVPYAVGRIHFDSPDEYAFYAKSVVEAETGKVALPRRAVFFGVQNDDDEATALSVSELVKPLAKHLDSDQKDWSVQAIIGRDQATKAQLLELLGGKEPPALLFTASHGVRFPKDHPKQLDCQGALLCQNWPGPLKWRPPIPREFYLCAEDVDDIKPQGLIAFNFACYSAGTPKCDEFADLASSERVDIAPFDFVASLPQRLLGRGGALAVVGHVDRAWGCSFIWEKAGPQLEAFESTLKELLEGHPIGSAMEYFNRRYAALSVSLMNAQKRVLQGYNEHQALVDLWTSYKDLQNYIILGDPAVRIAASIDEK